MGLKISAPVTAGTRKKCSYLVEVDQNIDKKMQRRIKQFGPMTDG